MVQILWTWSIALRISKLMVRLTSRSMLINIILMEILHMMTNKLTRMPVKQFPFPLKPHLCCKLHHYKKSYKHCIVSMSSTKDVEEILQSSCFDQSKRLGESPMRLNKMCEILPSKTPPSIQSLLVNGCSWVSSKVFVL